MDLDHQIRDTLSVTENNHSCRVIASNQCVIQTPTFLAVSDEAHFLYLDISCNNLNDEAMMMLKSHLLFDCGSSANCSDNRAKWVFTMMQHI